MDGNKTTITPEQLAMAENAFVERPLTDGGPKGSKSLGEPPAVPTPGAVANAIARATGARIHALPATPERVWQAIATGDDGSDT